METIVNHDTSAHEDLSGIMGDKELKKKLRNRQSAQRARDRQKARMRWLEREISVVTLKNETLQRENFALKEILQKNVPSYSAMSNNCLEKQPKSNRKISSDICDSPAPKHKRFKTNESESSKNKDAQRSVTQSYPKTLAPLKTKFFEESSSMDENRISEVAPQGSFRVTHQKESSSPVDLRQKKRAYSNTQETPYGPDVRGLNFGLGPHITPLLMAPILAPQLHHGYGIFPVAYNGANILLGRDAFSVGSFESRRPTTSYESEGSSHRSSDTEQIASA